MRKLCILLLLALPLAAFAEGTRTWEQSKFDEFEKGTAKGVAIGSEGWLELAPGFKPLATTPSTYLWSIVADNAGNAYVAAGAPARVYRIDTQGEVVSVFDPKELQVQALALAPDGTLFAATSPDGKVYKIVHKATAKNEEKPARVDESAKAKTGEKTEGNDVVLDPSYTATVYFDPKTKYIWDLALDSSGQLYIATGDHGEIFHVDRTGEGSIFFKSDEAHIRVLAFDKNNNLIAGSDGSGLIYRISPAGEAFVLYSAPKKEITALALDDAGNIYAAGAGEKRTLPAPAVQSAPAPAPPQPQPTPSVQGAPAPPPAQAATPPLPPPASGGSEVYRIATDGSPTRLWNSREELIYALSYEGSVTKDGHLLAATGNKGRIFSIRSNGEFTDLLKASATQVTGFARTSTGVFVSTSNLGKIFLLAPEPEGEGSYESDVFDARNFSRWGRAEVRGSSGNSSFFARSGNVDNPDRNWSQWAAVERGTDKPLEVPPARFVQWKAVLKPGQPRAHVDSVTLNYRPKNIAPEVEEVSVQVGTRYPAPVRSSSAERSEPVNSAAGSGGNKSYDVVPSAFRDRNSIAVRWTAQDDNDDELTFALFYRGDGENEWRPLAKDKITEKYFSFDSDLLPDGGYTIKVVASDAPSNTPEETLYAEKESSRFEVDTTPPRVEDLTASSDAEQVHVTFRATDSFSPVRRAEYSLDAGDWQFVEPVGQLSDAKSENYDFNISTGEGTLIRAVAAPAEKPKKNKRKKSLKPGTPPNASDPPSEEHVLVVRVYDRFDNVSSAKTVIKR